MFSGMSGQRLSLTRASTAPGSCRRWALARMTLLVAAITIAAGTPLSVTSPITRPMRPSRQLDEVVEVAADRARRAVERGQLPAGERRQHLRQEVLLDQLRHRELLLEAVAGANLDLLLAHELADAHRRRRLRGERLEQPAVVGRVVLVGEARPDVEQADQLAVGDERDDQRDAGGPHLGERRRVEIEVRQLDRSRGALK